MLKFGVLIASHISWMFYVKNFFRCNVFDLCTHFIYSYFNAWDSSSISCALLVKIASVVTVHIPNFWFTEFPHFVSYLLLFSVSGLEQFHSFPSAVSLDFLGLFKSSLFVSSNCLYFSGFVYKGFTHCFFTDLYHLHQVGFKVFFFFMLHLCWNTQGLMWYDIWALVDTYCPYCYWLYFYTDV